MCAFLSNNNGDSGQPSQQRALTRRPSVNSLNQDVPPVAEPAHDPAQHQVPHADSSTAAHDATADEATDDKEDDEGSLFPHF